MRSSFIVEEIMKEGGEDRTDRETLFRYRLLRRCADCQGREADHAQ